MEIVDVAPQPVVGLRREGHYRMIAVMIKEICEFLERRGIKITGSPIFVCHETSEEEAKDADKEGSADVEVAVPVENEIEDEGEFKGYILPGGQMAKTVHKGPYEECGPTYKELFAWLKENNKKLAGPTREVYINDPGEVNPKKILTEIYVPVE